MIKNKKLFLLWLFLVILWNFSFPTATPIFDVLVAVVLTLATKVLENHV